MILAEGRGRAPACLSFPELSIPRPCSQAARFSLPGAGTTEGTRGVPRNSSTRPPERRPFPGSLNVPREFAVATSLSNGNVLLTGGGSVWANPPGNALHYENTSDAETYDTTSGKWLLAGQQMIPRMGHTATLLRDGRVLVAGGVGSGDAPARLASAELYVQPDLSVPASPAAGTTQRRVATDCTSKRCRAISSSRRGSRSIPSARSRRGSWGSGRTAVRRRRSSRVVQPTGGAWLPNFDPARVTNNPWGTLKFTFTDCNHGRVDFDSIRGYGSGSMNLTRLDLPAGSLARNSRELQSAIAGDDTPTHVRRLPTLALNSAGDHPPRRVRRPLAPRVATAARGVPPLLPGRGRRVRRWAIRC